MSKPVFEDAFVFRGRRNRSSYLLFQLAVLVPTALLTLFAGALRRTEDGAMIAAILLALAGVVILWCGLAVLSQRCRDLGLSGWTSLRSSSRWSASSSPSQPASCRATSATTATVRTLSWAAGRLPPQRALRARDGRPRRQPYGSRNQIAASGGRSGKLPVSSAASSATSMPSASASSSAGATSAA